MKRRCESLCFLLLSGIGASLLSAAQPLEPAAHWSFNRCGSDVENGRAIILDGSGNRHHLQLSGATCVSGQYGRGGSFDGIDDSAATAANVLNFTDRLTVSAWVRPDVVSGVHTIVSKWYASDSYSLGLVDGQYIFTVAFPYSGWGTTVAVSTPATSGAWTHVAGVFDGAARKVRIYKGGLLKASASTPASSLQQSGRPVTVGNHPSWAAFDGRIDEIGLYATAMSSSQVAGLAARNKSLYRGADTNVHPEQGQYPNGAQNGYDFYAGRLGWAASTCRIQHPAGRDLITGEPLSLEQVCQFQLRAAAIARPERTFAYWWLAGPNHPQHGSMTPYQFGSYQASLLRQQRAVYRHIVYGRTLFADIEPAEGDSGGWDDCHGTGACGRNRALLDGFLNTIAASSEGLTPGVYTSPLFWRNIFGYDHDPGPFVLWLTGCNSACGRRVTQAEMDVVKLTALGGMKAVIYQYDPFCPGWDATNRNPSSGFAPVASTVAYKCTCDRIGGSCY